MPAPSKTRLRVTEVPNPYYSRAHLTDATNPRTIPAVINIRESAITTMAARGVLDAAQVAAATRFRGLWEAIRERLTAADRLRMGLDDLAAMWRLATRR